MAVEIARPVAENEALLTAISSSARQKARTLDRCAAIIGGGPAVGCFVDDLADDPRLMVSVMK